ncbi:hypothetical protein C7Y71_009270 [Pseudoprevotella muciniphila]|uniref:Uncharacterized protein n=1 Tax=Pseudoprevotella muciniphila TaxID=2133944 RepID=A0A5P8E8B0_9BACT|nr:hypothetical protein C7Y71_009270 [Pseudoprevotella muciniphila]
MASLNAKDANEREGIIAIFLTLILAAERRYSLGRGVKSKATETPVFQYIRNVNPIGVVQKKQIMVHLHTMNMMF